MASVIQQNEEVVVTSVFLYKFLNDKLMHNLEAFAAELEMRYRYSTDLVYNTFPWPEPTEEQKMRIEQTAQGILNARAKYPDASLADLYDELAMPMELRKAHQTNDRAVMEAYGFSIKMSEQECVAELMKMYRALTEE